MLDQWLDEELITFRVYSFYFFISIHGEDLGLETYLSKITGALVAKHFLNLIKRLFKSHKSPKCFDETAFYKRFTE